MWISLLCVSSDACPCICPCIHVICVHTCSRCLFVSEFAACKACARARDLYSSCRLSFGFAYVAAALFYVAATCNARDFFRRFRACMQFILVFTSSKTIAYCCKHLLSQYKQAGSLLQQLLSCFVVLLSCCIARQVAPHQFFA